MTVLLSSKGLLYICHFFRATPDEIVNYCLCHGLGVLEIKVANNFYLRMQLVKHHSVWKHVMAVNDRCTSLY